uniref:Uncharacterized protein LOC107482567 n=1 Tax=Rhizophora mucronata TaxID=61149 RepID=A0A2P2JAK2_RHIMU
MDAVQRLLRHGPNLWGCRMDREKDEGSRTGGANGSYFAVLEGVTEMLREKCWQVLLMAEGCMFLCSTLLERMFAVPYHVSLTDLASRTAKVFKTGV